MSDGIYTPVGVLPIENNHPHSRWTLQRIASSIWAFLCLAVMMAGMTLSGLLGRARKVRDNP